MLGVFLLLLFGTLEVARIFYVFNTLQEVTRRAAAAAAKTDFTDSTALQLIREDAVFRSAPGMLAFAAPVSDANVVIDYMSLSKASNGDLTLSAMHTLPDSPMASRRACMGDPYSDNCIQLVRVRICATPDATSCTPVALSPLIPLVNLSVNLPTATTIVKADSLGLPAGP